MRVLLDTNVVLDVFLNREPWVEASKAVWQAHDEGRVIGYVMACAITDIFYIARRLADLEIARAAVRVCLDTFEICSVGRVALEEAREKGGKDFEDNLQIACAAIAGLDGIVTRDKTGFKDTAMPVWTPEELLAQLS